MEQQMEKSAHIEQPFSLVNFPSEMSDNKSTCKCKNREEKEEGERVRER